MLYDPIGERVEWGQPQRGRGVYVFFFFFFFFFFSNFRSFCCFFGCTFVVGVFPFFLSPGFWHVLGEKVSSFFLNTKGINSFFPFPLSYTAGFGSLKKSALPVAPKTMKNLGFHPPQKKQQKLRLFRCHK